MSIKAYVGRMGSGKTYEVVSVVILGALRRGRRVITNIAGIDYAACADLLVTEGCDPDKIGRVVLCTHDDVMQSSFWLDEQGNEHFKKTFSDSPDQYRKLVDGVSIQPGDLVCLDEIWRFWQGFTTKDADGNKRPNSVMNFMRMHRHFTHPESGVSCDLAIITQDVMDISRQVRAVIEETYRMEKLTAIGSSKRYRVDVCQGGQTRKVLRDLQRAYEPQYFKLYSSHSGRKEGEAGPVEENIDGRGNVLSGALFKFIIPVAIVVFGFAVWTVYGFFTPTESGDKKAESVAAGASNEPVVASTVKSSRLEPSISDQWTVVGWWQTGDVMRVILTDGKRRRVIDPPVWRLVGLDVETFLPSGDAVAPWTGERGAGIIERASGQR